jgi:hypothetical protein
MRAREHRALSALSLVVVGAAIAYTRLKGITLSLWHDEVVSAARYSDSPAHVFTARYVPNNHMLFNVLAWLSRRVVPRDEVALRLPSVLPALAGVALAAWWAWRRFGPPAGALSALLIGLSHAHLELSRQARGYGLCFLAMAGVAVFADEYAADRRRRNLVAFSVFGLVGTLTLPVFVLPYALIICVLLALRCPWREIAIATSVSALVAVVWYAPVASDVFKSRDQSFGRVLPWHSFLTGPGDLLGRDQNRRPVLLQLVLIVTLVAAIFVATRLGRASTIVILVVPVCGTFAVLSILRFGVADRFVSFLLVPLSLVMAIGFSAAFAVPTLVPRLLLVAGIAALLVMPIREFRHVADRVDTLPIENFRGTARFVNSTGVRTVFTNSTRPDGLKYYLRPHLGIARRPGRLEQFLCGVKPPFVYIDHPFMSREPSVRCLEREGASKHVFRQRGRGRHIDVYVVAKGR